MTGRVLPANKALWDIHQPLIADDVLSLFAADDHSSVAEFIRESPTPVGKREIARAFGISGADRIPLKAMLKELEREGAVDRAADDR